MKRNQKLKKTRLFSRFLKILLGFFVLGLILRTVKCEKMMWKNLAKPAGFFQRSSTNDHKTCVFEDHLQRILAVLLGEIKFCAN